MSAEKYVLFLKTICESPDARGNAGVFILLKIVLDMSKS